MENYLLISDAAKEVKVESHVLRYWEEELHLPIKRNELGHRYYTKEDVERFRQIKNMKEKGLQLKAIKMILKDGKLSMLQGGATPEEQRPDYDADAVTKSEHNMTEQSNVMPISIVNTQELRTEISKEEKAQKLQWLLKQLIRDTLQENNQELCREIRESVVKELDYQFRNQEEREEEREREREKRNEAYYQKMDELLRQKSKSRGKTNSKGLIKNVLTLQDIQKTEQAEPEKESKKKRHFIF